MVWFLQDEVHAPNHAFQSPFLSCILPSTLWYLSHPALLDTLAHPAWAFSWAHASLLLQYPSFSPKFLTNIQARTEGSL